MGMADPHDLAEGPSHQGEVHLANFIVGLYEVDPEGLQEEGLSCALLASGLLIFLYKLDLLFKFLLIGCRFFGVVGLFGAVSH